jgi:hypothetical protein
MRSIRLVVCAFVFIPTSLAAQPAANLGQADFDTISIARVAGAPNGKNLALTFHATDAAKTRASAGTALPPRVTVGIDGKPVDFQDVTGTGTYTAYRRAGSNRAPAAPIFTRTNSPATPNFGIEFVECPPGCRSVIFRTRCIVCVKKIEW